VVGLGIALFVLFCLPYLQLIPYSTWSLANDRHLFLSIFAGALPVGVLLQRRRSVLLRLAVLVVTVAGVALTYRQASKWGDLERLIEDASRFSPGDFYAQQLHIQQILLPQRRYEEARGKAAGVRDPLAEAFLLKNIRVRQAIDEGRWDDAQRDGSELAYLAERSSHPELQLLLGTLAERRRDDVEALRHYSRAARIGLTSDVLSGARRGLASVRLGYADSLETLRAAAAGRPYDVVAQANLANLQMQLFLLDEAAERYRWILQGYASLAGARYNLGLIYLRQDRYRDATRELRRAITGGVASAVVWNNLGIAHKHAGDIDEAETAYIRALQLDPNHCNAAINLGRLYLAFGKLGQARAALLRARESACGVDVDGLIELYLSQVAGERQS
jgi:Flp pilus assembly protein TadD